MFESMRVITTPDYGHASMHFNTAILLEGLAYYKTVNVFSDEFTLPAFFSSFLSIPSRSDINSSGKLEVLKRWIQNGHLALIVEDRWASYGGHMYKDPCVMSLAGFPNEEYEEEYRKLLIERTSQGYRWNSVRNRGLSQNDIANFLELLDYETGVRLRTIDRSEAVTYMVEEQLPNKILKCMIRKEENYRESCLLAMPSDSNRDHWYSRYKEEFPEHARRIESKYKSNRSPYFKVFRNSPGSYDLNIDTNITFRENPWPIDFGPHTLLNKAYFLALAIRTVPQGGGDLVLRPALSDVFANLVNSALAEVNLSRFESAVFQNYNFDTAFNKGGIFLEDIDALLDNKEKWTEWAAGVSPDLNFVEEYFKAVHSSGFLSKGSMKIARFGAITGVGMGVDFALAGATAGAGTFAGLALSAFDSFLLDRIASGWTPNIYTAKISNLGAYPPK